MRRTRFDQWDCSIARTVDLLGDWWTPMVVRGAFLGARRFEQFQESLGIPRNVLAERLRTLVEEGVLEKREYQDRPVRYEYRLTEKGVALYPVIVAMMKWGDEWLDWPEGPPVELLDRETGEPVEPVLVDGRTGAPLDPRKVTVRRRRGADPGWPRAVPTPRRDPRPLSSSCPSPAPA